MERINIRWFQFYRGRLEDADHTDAAGCAINTLDREVAEKVQKKLAEKYPEWNNTTLKLSRSGKSYTLLKSGGFVGNDSIEL